jgi:hypothetical protein
MAAMDTDVNMVAVGESSSSGASSSAKKTKRFEIKKWNAVSLWAWGDYYFFRGILFSMCFCFPTM